MPRKNLIRSSKHFYHVTSRNNNRDWFEIDMDHVWKYANESLASAQIKHPAEIAQFVLMSNHYHLLIKTPNADIDKFMYEFNKLFTQNIRRHSKRINKILGGRYKWSIITNDQYFITVYRYIYQNPLRAKIVRSCQHYPYSTFYFEVTSSLNSLKFLLTSHINHLLVESSLEANLGNIQQVINYIDDLYDEKSLKEIRLGVKKSTFKLVSPRKY
jgi:putative transposase